MPNPRTTIPRFLLPQLTWRAPGPRLILSTPNPPSHSLRPASNNNSTSSNRTASSQPFSSPLQRRALTTSAVTSAARPDLAPGTAWNDVYIRSALTRPQQPTRLPLRKIQAALGAALVHGQHQHRQEGGSRGFSASARSYRDHHFDTLKFVQRLREEGFSEEQATAMMRVLADVIEESIQNLTRTMVLREDAERSTYTQKVDFTKLRSELLSSDSAETTLTRASHERLANDYAKLNSRLRDEIGRTQASVRLDLNLEKGRIREEANVQELRIKETEARIEQEVAGLRERIEGVKFSTLQWLMGVCTGTAALILGAWRLLM